jgi:hypothetical protein
MDELPVPAAPAGKPRRWLIVGLGLFFIALSGQYAWKVRGADRDSRSAFLRWRPQILDLAAGINVYERHNYPNPPIMGLLLAPLAQLPPMTGSLAWFFLKAGMAVLAIHWVFRLVESSDRPFPAWAQFLAVLLGLRPLVGDLTHGNVNVFIFFLVVAALTAFRHRRQQGAGVLLALAIACKVTPALFLPYFFWKRAWKVLAGCAIGLGLFVVVVPGLYLGLGRNATLHVSWAQHMVLPFVVEGKAITEHQNQSLPGVVYRLTTRAASFSEYQDQGYVPTEYHNLVTLPDQVASWLVRIGMGLFVGVLMWSCRTPGDSRERWRLAGEYCLVFLGMLLLSERTWKHHYVPLILPLAALLYFVSVRRAGRGRRRFVVGAMTVAMVLMALTGTGIPGFPERFGKVAEVYGAYLWANLLLMAAVVVVLRTPATSVAEVETYQVEVHRLSMDERLERDVDRSPITASRFD